MGKELAMKLASEALKRHFEKSERMNLLQQRIMAYCALLRDRYNDRGFKETRDIPMLERWKARGLEQPKSSEIPLKEATLEFRCHINSDDPAVSQEGDFYLCVGDKFYDLAADNLPSRYIELVYESLSQLTELMQASGDPLALTIASEVTEEILAYLA